MKKLLIGLLVVIPSLANALTLKCVYLSHKKVEIKTTELRDGLAELRYVDKEIEFYADARDEKINSIKISHTKAGVSFASYPASLGELTALSGMLDVLTDHASMDCSVE